MQQITAAFERNQSFINRGRCRIRRRNDRCNHTDRAGDLEDSLLFVFIHDPDRLHGTDCAVDIVGTEEILQCLVLDGSIARLFNSHARQGFGVCDAGLRNFSEDALDLIFREVLKVQPGIVGRVEEIPRFLNRFEVLFHTFMLRPTGLALRDLN